MQIPLAEFPGLEEALALTERVTELESRVEQLEGGVQDAKRSSATLLSGLLPGGVVHDRVAEVRAAVKELVENPGQEHSSAERALMLLNWGQMSVEG